MTRTEKYLSAHPELQEFFEIIQRVQSADHITVTVTTGTSNCQLVNHLENPRLNIAYFAVNNIDEATLLIQGKKNYSFGLASIKIVCIESVTGENETNYKIKFTHYDDAYQLDFHVLA